MQSRMADLRLIGVVRRKEGEVASACEEGAAVGGEGGRCGRDEKGRGLAWFGCDGEGVIEQVELSNDKSSSKVIPSTS